MKIRFDATADALYVELSGDLVTRTEQIDPGTLADLDAHGRLVGIEVIRPARSWPLDKILDRFEPADPDGVRALREMLEDPEGPSRFWLEDAGTRAVAG